MSESTEHDQMGARSRSRLSQGAPFAAAVACGMAMTLAILLAPGRTGAAIVQAAAAAAFAVFAVSGFRRMNANENARTSGGFANIVHSLAPSQQSALRGAAIAALAIGAAAVIAFGALGSDSSGDDPRAFALGIAGFIAATAAFVAWANAFLRDFARWNNAVQPPDNPGEQAEAPDSPAYAISRRFKAESALCFAVIAIGLALCFNIGLTPLSNRSSWAALCGFAVIASLATCAWLLFRTPKMARQIGSLHDRYESTISELDEAQSKMNALEHDMASLRARHDDALRRGRDLESQVSSLRIQRDEKDRPETIEACMAIAGEFDLSRRETDVLVLLSRGYSRKRAAEELIVEPSTVSSHVNRLYRKLDVHSSQELIDFVESYR